MNREPDHLALGISDPAVQILANLERWHEHFEASQQPSLQASYKYSPEYDDVWAISWSAYDALIDQQRGSNRLPWQQSIEDFRNDEISRRAELYQPMKDNLWNICPLSVHLDRYTGVHSQDRLYTWKATWTNWHRFRDTYNQTIQSGAGEYANKPFRHCLSDTQLSSYKILEDWWCSHYAPPKFASSARMFIQDRLELVDLLPIASLSSSSSNMVAHSLYHSYCFLLFIREFNPQGWEPYISYDYLFHLQQLRHDAILHAISQRLAYTTLYPDRLQCAALYPRICWNNTTWHVLRNKQTPTYLWDTIARATLTVPACFSHEYTCISHTWGRWRLASSATLPGVPWNVPENSLYDVRDLPRLLGQLGIRYIWFDLFCIPQDNPALRDFEISRQTIIFQGSAACIAWLHDVDSWTGVQAAMDWMGVKYFSNTTKFTAELSVGKESLSRASEAADRHVELMPLPAIISAEVADANNARTLPLPVSWFSSLWTLQEAVLCPNLELYSKNWARLEDRAGYAVTLSALMAMMHKALSYITSNGPAEASISDPEDYSHALMVKGRGIGYRDMSIPLGASNLVHLMTLTGLPTILLGRSPSRIFINANIRQCTGSRAPAIMSAIGVTDWYSRRLDRKEPGRLRRDNLVYGMYPLEFLKETFQKYGALFLDGQWYEKKRVSTWGLIRRKVAGSMMPFTREVGWFTDRTIQPEGVRIESVDDPSIASWKIRADGTLKVRFAGILACSKDTNITREAVLAWMDHDGRHTAHTLRLGEKLGEIAGENGILYAVMLYKDHYRQYGVLLHGPRTTVLGRRYLLKIGRIITYEPAKIPLCSKVRWVIL